MKKIDNQLISIGLSLVIGLTTIGAMSGSLSSYAAPPKKGVSAEIDEDLQMMDSLKSMAYSALFTAQTSISAVRSQLSNSDLSIQVSNLDSRICTLQSALESAASSSDVQMVLLDINCLESEVYGLQYTYSALESAASSSDVQMELSDINCLESELYGLQSTYPAQPEQGMSTPEDNMSAPGIDEDSQMM